MVNAATNVSRLHTEVGQAIKRSLHYQGHQDLFDMLFLENVRSSTPSCPLESSHFEVPVEASDRRS